MHQDLVRIHDIEMYYQLRGEGKPLLLLHGFMGSGADWRLVFEEPPEGYQLLEVDLRGHGQSTNPGNEFTFRQCAQDVIALLRKLDTGPVNAIGLSGGGQTLLHMATAQPALIGDMILVSAGHYFPDEARKFMAMSSVESMTDAEWQEMRARHRHGDS